MPPSPSSPAPLFPSGPPRVQPPPPFLTFSPDPRQSSRPPMLFNVHAVANVSHLPLPRSSSFSLIHSPRSPFQRFRDAHRRRRSNIVFFLPTLHFSILPFLSFPSFPPMVKRFWRWRVRDHRCSIRRRADEKNCGRIVNGKGTQPARVLRIHELTRKENLFQSERIIALKKCLTRVG